MIDVLLDDPPCLAVNKPPGLLTQGPRAAKATLEMWVKQHIKETSNKTGNVYLGVPHRLDRCVTGAVLFARNSKGAARLAEIFRDRRVTKTYWAVLEKRPDSISGELVDWLLKAPGAAMAEIVAPATEGAQEARLRYRVTGDVPGGVGVEIHPETGRFHQIRAQFGARGCPVVGDLLYGASSAIDPDEAGWIEDGSEAAPMPVALHARRLELPHPVRFEPITIEAPVPSFWANRGWSPPTA